ncbi:MAG: MFS transporter [Desulfarculus sp.]|nr:MFS transporter [Desulfarculus sp.]
MARRPRRLFHGWRMVGVAFLANLLSTGTTFYVFNAFLLPLCQARGWTRAEVNAAPMLGFVLGLMAQFVYGSLFWRVGPRALMVAGCLVSSAAFIFLGRVQGLGAFYALYTLLYLGNGAMNGIVANTVVANWFVRRRGLALGLATAGMSVSGVVLPYLALVILERLGLEAAFMIIGLLALGLAPLAWFTVRPAPESMGLMPDGDADPPGDREPWLHPEGAPPEASWTTGHLLRAPAFWRLGAVYSLAMMGAVGVTYQLAPRFQDLGLDGHRAVLLTALTAALATVGKFWWGWLCDLVQPRRVVAALLLAKALGLGLGLITGSQAALWAFIIVFGLAMGGVMSTFPIMAAHLFGRQDFWRVYRLLVLFLALQGLGYLIMGQSFSRTGSYDLAFWVFLALDLLAAWLALGLPPREIAPPGLDGQARPVGDLTSRPPAARPSSSLLINW